MQLAPFQALTFDCYGTLIDWEAGILAALRPWARQAGLSLDDGALLEAFGGLESQVQRAHPDWLYPRVLAEVHRRLAASLGVPADEAAAEAFGASVGDWPAFPDSAAALAELQRHYKLGILSNIDRASFALSARRLGVTFDLVVTAQDVGSYKPDPRNFQALLAAVQEKLGIAREGVLHVAQSLFHDIAPARRMGLPTVWVNRRRGRAGMGATPAPEGDATPDLEVGTLEELAALRRRE